jgi:hypothetical protein
LTYIAILLNGLLILWFKNHKAYQFILYFFLLALLVLVAGFRFEIGGDWFAYLEWYQNYENQSLGILLKAPSKFYTFLNITSSGYGGIYFVNLVCALILVIGLHHFSSYSKDPKFVFVSMIPFLFIVFAMGFVRQALALSLVLLVFNRHIVFFLLGSVLALLSHSSIVLAIPFYYYYQRSVNFSQVLGIIFFSVLILFFFQDRLFAFYEFYILDDAYQSAGAFYRILPITLILFFFFVRHLIKKKSNSVELLDAIFTCIFPFCLLFLMLILGLTTAADRVFYFFLPLVAFYISESNTCFKIGKVISAKNIFLILNYFLFLMWLLLSDHGKYWYPYKNVLFN